MYLSGRLVAQGIHKLPDLMPLAFRLLRRFFGDSIVEFEFVVGFGGFASLPVGLSQAIVRLFYLRVRLDGLLVVGNRLRIISLFGMKNTQLEVRSGKLRVETNRIS